MTVEYLTSEGKVLTRKVAWLSYVASMLATRMVDGSCSTKREPFLVPTSWVAHCLPGF